jgi:ATP-dependent Zn protease
MAQLIDQEMRRILEDAYQRATDILTTQQQKLEA